MAANPAKMVENAARAVHVEMNRRRGRLAVCDLDDTLSETHKELATELGQGYLGKLLNHPDREGIIQQAAYRAADSARGGRRKRPRSASDVRLALEPARPENRPVDVVDAINKGAESLSDEDRAVLDIVIAAWYHGKPVQQVFKARGFAKATFYRKWAKVREMLARKVKEYLDE